MKRTLLMAAFALLGMSGLRAEVHNGICGAEGDGSNLTWQVDTESRTLTISGTGKMKDYFPNAGSGLAVTPWYFAQQDISTVVIEIGTSHIGNYAFYGCQELTTVSLPNSVTGIGEHAFAGCDRLAEIAIPNSVKSIGMYAFMSCGSLTEVEIPNGVADIGRSAFSGCGSLTTVTLPNSITTVGYKVFSGCGQLAAIAIPHGVTRIEEWAFSECSSLANVTLPCSLSHIENSAFYGCTEIREIHYTGDIAQWCGIYFENGDSNPLSYADHFYVDGQAVTALSIPSSITTIHPHAFSGCGFLTEITLPNSITGIGEYAFDNCHGLTTMDIPNSVESIGNYAFSGCSILAEVTFGNSVTRIGEGAFINCYQLTQADIPNSVKSIGDYAFNYLPCLEKLTFGNGVESIGENAFGSCGRLTTIAIPNSVKSIGDYAFAFCSGLKEVTIGKGVERIGDNGFMYCSKLEQLHCHAVIPPTIGQYTFDHVSKEIGVSVPCVSEAAYQAAEYWNEFDPVIGIVPLLSINSADEMRGSTRIVSPVTCETAEATIAATANAGYRFVRWSDGNTENPRTLTVTEDMTLTAEFEAKEPTGLTETPDGIRVYAEDGVLHVMGVKGAYGVHDMTGREVYLGTAASVELPGRGVYVVKAGEATVKVVW